MIELTDEQLRAIRDHGAAPPRLLNPRTHETFVLFRADEYDRLKEKGYDDNPWPREELHALARAAGKGAGREDMPRSDHAGVSRASDPLRGF